MFKINSTYLFLRFFFLPTPASRLIFTNIDLFPHFLHLGLPTAFSFLLLSRRKISRFFIPFPYKTDVLTPENGEMA